MCAALRVGKAERLNAYRPGTGMMEIGTAGMLSGHKSLGNALVIRPRRLRAKMSSGLGTPAADMLIGAGVSGVRAERAREHARTRCDVAGW